MIAAPDLWRHDTGFYMEANPSFADWIIRTCRGKLIFGYLAKRMRELHLIFSKQQWNVTSVFLKISHFLRMTFF